MLVAHDTRFFSEEFARTAAIVLTEHGVRALVCRGATPTPTVAWEVRRAKLDGAINFTASHNPAEYHGLKFSDAERRAGCDRKSLATSKLARRNWRPAGITCLQRAASQPAPVRLSLPFPAPGPGVRVD